MIHLKEFVDKELPGEDGWWSEDNRIAFYNAGDLYLWHCVDLDKIKEILSDLYASMKNEFGG